jgi:hypothetical protein
VIVFIDTEFTDLRNPELLSLGAVTLDGREHYVELDLSTDFGRARVKAASDFVKYDGGILDMWGLVPGAVGTQWEMGRRTGEWLLQLAAESGERIEVAFDYETDYELLEFEIRDSGLWDRVREVVVPVNIGTLTGAVNGDLAAEEFFRQVARRGLRRHHALADALALRAAYQAVKADLLALDRFVRSAGYLRLLEAVTTGVERPEPWELWLRNWLSMESSVLDDRRPIDVVADPGGLERVEAALMARKRAAR